MEFKMSTKETSSSSLSSNKSSESMEVESDDDIKVILSDNSLSNEKGIQTDFEDKSLLKEVEVQTDFGFKSSFKEAEVQTDFGFKNSFKEIEVQTNSAIKRSLDKSSSDESSIDNLSSKIKRHKSKSYDKIKEENLNLKLRDNLKKRLIDLISKFNLVLNGLEISSDYCNDLISECNYILIEISSLELIKDEKLSSTKSISKIALTKNQKYAYTIDWKYRSTIINKLIRNKNLTILNNKKICSNTKKRMFKRNTNLITQLLNLKITHVDDDDKKSDLNSIDENMIDRNDEILKLRKSVNDIKEDMFVLREDIMTNCEEYFAKEFDNEELAYGLQAVESRLDNLEERIDDGEGIDTVNVEELEDEFMYKIKAIETRLDDVDITRPNATFDFQIDNLKKLMEEGGKRSSELFYCQGLFLIAFIKLFAKNIFLSQFH